jgi:hypothetical protein
VVEELANHVERVVLDGCKRRPLICDMRKGPAMQRRTSKRPLSEQNDSPIGVFLKESKSICNERSCLAEIETYILYEIGAVINGLPFLAGAYRDRTPCTYEVRREHFERDRSQAISAPV